LGIEEDKSVATISDVARQAGVSVSTVSHVVNGTRHVNPATMALVKSAIDSLGFVPNAVARSLAMSTTKAVGIAISVSTNYYFLVRPWVSLFFCVTRKTILTLK
jgi:LacI family transcriptional regulator